MKFFYLCREAIRLFGRFRLRSFLMVGSTTVGAAGMIVSTNYATAGRSKVAEQIRRMGTDLVLVTPRPSKSVAGRARTGSFVTTLRPADEEAIRREALEIVASSPIASSPFLVKAGDLSKPACPIVGCGPSYFAIRDWPLAKGRFFDARDLRSLARVAVLGSTVAQDLFPDRSPVGQRISVNRVPMEVIGVLQERGQSLEAANEDAQVYVPVSTACARLLNRAYLNAILFRVSSSASMQVVIGEIDVTLQHRHRPQPKQPADYQIQTRQQTLETWNASSKRLAFLVRSLGVSGLVISGLGVFALCWIAVRDRTKELGTRRALGATSIDIFLQIFLETGLASFTGAALAWLLGSMASRVAESRADLPLLFDPVQAAGLVAYSILLNQTFGFLAARRAAQIDPITALKQE